VKHAKPGLSDGLEITVDHRTEGACVRLRGHLSIDSSPELRDRLLAIFGTQPPASVDVDLTEVLQIDTSGVATLLEALKIARNHNSVLCLVGLQGRALRLFEAAGLLGLFEKSGCKNLFSEPRTN